MSSITWLHLSDLHFRADEPGRAQHRWDEDIVLRALLEDVRRQRAEGLEPDLILVSGDLAYSGAPAEYALARAFFDDLLSATDLPRDRLILVPGNHDVDRRRIGYLARQVAPTLTGREAINGLLADPDGRRTMLARLDGYAAFVAGYLAAPLPFADHYFSCLRLDLAGRSVAVLGLNSTWLAEGGAADRSRLALGERQVRAALDAAAGADLRLALLHHPFDWLGDADRADVEALLCQSCHFVLHGHLHQAGLLLARTPDAEAMVVAAGACYDTRTAHNSYNWVRLDPDAGRGTVHLRLYSDRGGGFWTRDVLSYRNVPDGVYAFALGGLRPGAPEGHAPGADRGGVSAAGRGIVNVGDRNVNISGTVEGDVTVTYGQPEG